MTTLSLNPYYPNPKPVTMSWSTAIANFFEFANSLLKIQKAGDQIKNVVAIYDNMNYTLAKTRAQRFVVMKAENGGGIVRPGASLYGSIIYEDYRHPVHSVKSQWQRFEFDAEYMKLMMAVYTHNAVKVHTEKLPPSLLKNAYTTTGIKYTEFYYLHHSKKAFFYCAISTSIEGETFQDARSRNEITIAVNNIRNLLKK